MRIINIGKVDKNIIPIIFGCIFYFLSRLLFTVKETKLFKHAIIPNMYACIAKMFAIIPFIILKIRTKRLQKYDTQKIMKNNTRLIYRNTKSEIMKGKWIYIILSSVLIFIQGLLLSYSLGIKSNSWIWDILITSIFYYVIFRVKLYKHHYISIIIIILTGFILDLVFKNLQNDIKNNVLFLLMRFLREIIFSLVDVINKYLMEKKFCFVYELTFYSGFFGAILYGIFSILSYYYLKIDDFGEYYDNINRIEILVTIGLFITQLGVYIFQLFTNKNNTPCHIFILYVFGQLANYMDFSTNSIILIIGLIFILFMSLVFNEIIEINICGLSENTKKNIVYRAEIDNLIIEKNLTINSFDEDNEKRDIEIELQNNNL